MRWNNYLVRLKLFFYVPNLNTKYVPTHARHYMYHNKNSCWEEICRVDLMCLHHHTNQSFTTTGIYKDIVTPITANTSRY